MISFEPLRRTLKEQNMVLSDFREEGINSRTLTAINAGQSVNLSTVEKICKKLKVPIEKVVEIRFED